MNTAMVFSAIGGILAFIVLGFVIGARFELDKMQKEAVARGHARFNPETRKFEWNIWPGVKHED
jgi:hypothetical protein